MSLLCLNWIAVWDKTISCSMPLWKPAGKGHTARTKGKISKASLSSLSLCLSRLALSYERA